MEWQERTASTVNHRASSLCLPRELGSEATNAGRNRHAERAAQALRLCAVLGYEQQRLVHHGL